MLAWKRAAGKRGRESFPAAGEGIAPLIASNHYEIPADLR